MKLYISYYGNYVTIVEGIYKKGKFNIKYSTFISSDDIKVDSSDKYSLLKEALKVIDTKVKNVVLLLNTKDIIVKSNQMERVEPKDLDGIMKNEIDEMMSLHDEQYTFSYEVTNEAMIDGKEVIDVSMAAIANEELDNILRILKSYKLNVERIDTMPTAYGRLLNGVEYNGIMMLNVGSYGSSVDIYKEDSLFIHDNIPVRVNEASNYLVSTALVEEIRGLMNFFSSRNFGKSVDTIVLVGESNKNIHIREGIEGSFNSKLVVGIENLLEIEDYIIGDLPKERINMVCDILGSMLIPKYNSKEYAYMNLTHFKNRNKNNKQEKLKQSLIIVPIVLAVLASPYLAFNILTNKVNESVVVAQTKLDKIVNEYKNIEDINVQIKSLEEEIGIYDMLSSKSAKWGNVLSAIDKSIPYRVDLTKLDSYYEEEPVSEEEGNTDDKKDEQVSENKTETENTEEVETPIYNQIPNIITIDGIAKTPELVGQFVYSLNKAGYFESVKLTKSTEDNENGGYAFNIILVLKEGVVSGG